MDAFDVFTLPGILSHSRHHRTIPTVAIAPLLVLWFGFEMTPKIILIILVTFFPVTVGLLDGSGPWTPTLWACCGPWAPDAGRSSGYLKCPFALPHFFSGLRIAAAYSVVGAVMSEWLPAASAVWVFT